jgi:nucleotide-binding universal stress UspA family protein
MYAAHEYLRRLAADLEKDGFSVRTQVLVMGTPAAAITEAVKEFEPDMIACATHGRGPVGRLWWGSVGWIALTHSKVPVLLRHPERALPERGDDEASQDRRIMVPLDGLDLAERALPFARQLAEEWGAWLWLFHVVSDMLLAPMGSPLGSTVPVRRAGDDVEVERRLAGYYLTRLAGSLPDKVQVAVCAGPTVDTLARAVRDLEITDVVMASHARSGLSRIILGSVADGLVQRLHIPILVIPALAAETIDIGEKDSEVGVAAGV